MTLADLKPKTPLARPEKLIDIWLQSLAAAAMGQSVRCVVVGRNAVVRVPLAQDPEAGPRPVADFAGHLGRGHALAAALATRLWRCSGSRTRKHQRAGRCLRRQRLQDCAEKDEDPALARTYPTVQDLLATGALDRLAQAVYAPLKAWAAEAEVEALPDAPAVAMREERHEHRTRPERPHFPLRGSHLIEASAGTGKTWTIAALYVRLVLGHGDGRRRRARAPHAAARRAGDDLHPRRHA